MTQIIHPTAIIDPKAELDSSVEVGPYSIIGPNVRIDAGTRIGSHVVIKGPTTIGKHNHIFQYSSLGEQPQDKKYRDEPTTLEIGDNNTIREFCTFNRGTVQDKGATRIGNDNWIMAYVHIGHDSVVGNRTVLVNNAALAGHVRVGDWAVLSGYTLVHQFCQIGAHAFTGMGSAIGKDVPAFVTVSGAPAEAKTINQEGMRRRGFSSAVIGQLRRAFKIVYRQGLTLEIALQRLEALPDRTPELALMIDSIKASERGIVR